MTLLIFTQIFFVCLIGAMSPGPSMVVVVNNAIYKNRYHGILTSIGHGIGITIYAIFAVIGIGLIIKTNIIIFNSIKIISIAFLIYLGIKSLFNNKQISFDQKKLSGSITSFFEGLTIAVLNPKIFIWFVAIYSQFMTSKNDILFNVYLVMTAGIVDASWYVFLTIMATSDVALSFLKNKSNVLQKILGFVFIILGIGLTIDLYLTIK